MSEVLSNSPVMTKISRDFYTRDALTVTKDLLGKYLINVVKGHNLIGKIVEVEAYIGPHDKASHSFRNLRTSRTEIQYGERGHAYIFRVYGVHHCFCVVVGRDQIPAVTLIRAIQPIQGIEVMKNNRKMMIVSSLTNGPAKLCKAFDITQSDYGIDLCGDRLYITSGESIGDDLIVTSPRIGIDYAEEWKLIPWRYYIRGNPFISRV